MVALVAALEFVRDRLLVAMTHLQRDETEEATSEIEAATVRLREVTEEMRT